MIEVGSEFQTNGAEHRKERFANSVLTKDLTSSGTSDKGSVRADSRNFVSTEAYIGPWTEVCWYCGAADLVLHHSQLAVNSAMNRQPVQLA